MDWLLPLFVISRVPRPSRAAFAEQLLPIALPGPSSQRLALAAIGAERQLARQALVEQRLVEEAVTIGQFTRPADLARFPALESAFKRLPAAVQTRIFRPAPPVIP